MSVGHLDHDLLTVYSSMEHMAWKSPSSYTGETGKKFGLKIKKHKKEVDSVTARARESSVTHKSAITDHAMKENYLIDWDKVTVVDREAQQQSRRIRCTLDQEDTDTHESGCRILPT